MAQFTRLRWVCYGRPLTVLMASLLSVVAPLPSSGLLRPVAAQTAGSEDRGAEADRLFQEAVSLWRKSQYQQAFDNLTQALRLYREVGNRRGEGNTLTGLGAVYDSLGQYPQALEQYQQALAIARDIGDKAGEGTTLSNIGLVYDSLGQYPQALEQYQQALAIARDIGDKSGESTRLSNIGAVYKSLGQYPQALEQYQQALAIARDIGDKLVEGTILSNIGLVYDSLGQYPQALEQYQQALAIARDIGNKSGEGITLSNIGLVHDSLGQYPQALEQYQQALVIARDIGNKSGEGTILSNIGLVYKSLGQYPQALEQYQQALAIARDIGNKSGEGITLSNIGLVYDSLGQYPQALEQYQQALAIARDIGNKSGEGITLSNIGLVYDSLGQYPQALEQYQQALAIARDIGDKSGEGTILGNIGYVLETQKQSEAAIVVLKQSVNTYETIRINLRSLPIEQQKSYTETVAGAYRTLADLLLSQGRILEAEKVLNLLKTEEIREYSRGAVANPQSRTTLPPSAAEQVILDKFNSIIAFAAKIAECQRQACDQIADLQAKRRALTQEFDQVVNQFKAEVAARRAKGDPAIELDNLTSMGADIVKAQPNTVLVYPVVLKEKLWVLWVSQTGVANAIEVPVTEAEITKAVFEFRNLMRSCERGGCDSAAAIQQIQTVSHKIYNWVMPPQLEQEFEQNGIENIVFSPDSTLRYIPMSALFDGKQYLIEKYTVSTITAAGLTNRDTPLPPGNQAKLLALGLSQAVPENPATGMLAFSDLPNVPSELAAIVNPAKGGIYPGTELLDQTFTQNAFLQVPSHQILHIATHGYFDPSSFAASYLVLGTKLPWHISEISADRQLFADVSLVVLSACETALGLSPDGSPDGKPNSPKADGREISSIAQAFVDAGANTVIASLWNVNDRSTSTLMQQFYQNLSSQPQITIAKAMQQAQLKLLHSPAAAQPATQSPTPPSAAATVAVVPNPDTTRSPYAHPYYWSAFTIIGNGL